MLRTNTRSAFRTTGSLIEQLENRTFMSAAPTIGMPPPTTPPQAAGTLYVDMSAVVTTVKVVKNAVWLSFDNGPSVPITYKKGLTINLGTIGTGGHHVVNIFDDYGTGVSKINIKLPDKAVNEAYIYNSSIPVKVVGGMYSNDTQVVYATGSYAKMTLVGGSHTTTHFQSSAGNTEYWGGTKALGIFTSMSKVGTQTFHGGNDSTNIFLPYGGKNVIFDGSNAKNETYWSGGSGIIHAGVNSSDTLYLPPGAPTNTGYILDGKVTVVKQM